jgi:hypothetical protein
MSTSKLNGIQALKNMRKHIGTAGFQGWCHKTCQNAWGLPVKYASAIDAWNHIPKEARHTDFENAPIGAPIFFNIGKFGHVVIQSDKKGVVIGTDSPKKDFVGEVPLTWFKKNWGVEPLGWASIYNDVKLTMKKLPE